jgi:hypothetical protein
LYHRCWAAGGDRVSVVVRNHVKFFFHFAVVRRARDGHLALWDVPSQTCSSTLSFADPLAGNDAVALYMVDESVLLCARGSSASITVHDVRMKEAAVRKMCCTTSSEGIGAFTALSVLHESSLVASGSDTGGLFLFDWRSGALSKEVARKNDAKISALSSSGWVGNSLGQAWSLFDEAQVTLPGPEFQDGVVGISLTDTSKQLCTVSKVYLYK